MSIKEHWAIITIIIFLLAVLYPVSVIASYSGVEGSMFQPKLKKDSSELNSNMYPENNQTVTVWDMKWNTISYGNQTQYSSSKINLFDLTIKFAEPTPFKVLLKNNGTYLDYAILNQMNITVVLNIRAVTGLLVKQFTDTFSLNNKTSHLVITKTYIWQPPTPPIFDGINPFAEQHYQLDYVINKIYDYNNGTSSTTLRSNNSGSLVLKSVNLIPIALIYSITIVLLAISIFFYYTKKLKH